MKTESFNGEMMKISSCFNVSRYLKSSIFTIEKNQLLIAISTVNIIQFKNEEILEVSDTAYIVRYKWERRNKTISLE